MATALCWACFAMLLGCEGIENGGPEAGAERTLSGNVVYRERMALPAGATVEVRLEDVSIADAAAPIIAQQSITPGDQQVPIPFRLEIPAGAIEPNHRYGVRAEIRAPTGELLFTTTEHHDVLGPEPPAAGIDILVRRAGPQAGAAGPLDGGPWQLVVIQRVGQAEEPVGAEPAYTIEFGADGRFFGQAHCNRYTGGYTTPAADRLEMTAGASTLMACPEPSIADEFLRMLSATSRYEMRADRLWLMADDGAALGFARTGPWADAARRGVTFRAIGNEPSWHIEITPEKLAMITELGARRTEAAYEAPVTEGQRTTYRAADADIVAVIEQRACSDTMSGEPFEATATVTFEGTTYHGCGRFL